MKNVEHIERRTPAGMDIQLARATTVDNHNRILYTMAETADMLGISLKLLRRHCEARDIRYVLLGKRTRRFAQSDIDQFLEKRRQCQFTSAQGHPSGGTNSKSVVTDFVAAHKLRLKRKPRG